ncbi:uncharacterized protein LOC131942678 [Physella acuta]|uniref:uncharacterized protein LOC131942678 n=1 Tax=Physella acuta TaxID=109671 RepID=UPI0027DCF92B|nr:uncharacterized protein LOC131942678 [Physella acuta]
MIEGKTLEVLKLAVMLLVVVYPNPGWSGPTDCGTLVLYEDENTTCQPRSICAYFFDHFKAFNGPQCNHNRTTYRCLCGKGTRCPVDNSHRIYIGYGKSAYTCEQTCKIPWCGSENKNATLDYGEVAPDRYTTLECRCPRHHNSTLTRNQTATKLVGSTVLCDYQANERITDPCKSTT